MKSLLIITISAAILLLSCAYLPNQVVVPNQVNASSPVLLFPRAGGDAAPMLVSLYGSAIKKIDIAIYSLTHPDIVKAITDAKKRGISIRIISDKIQAAGNSQKHAINDLLLTGVPVKINTHSGLMHLKMSIVDSSAVTLGSYNYSMAASNTNDEVMIIINDPQIILSCQNEFDRLWASPKFKDAESSY